MSERQFQPGDRVSTKLYGEGVVIGPSARFASCFVVERDNTDRDPRRCIILDSNVLTLIPETVTVTVELTREQAEARAELKLNPRYPFDSAGNAFAAACREALS